jgi:hypothetical protein
LEFTEFPCISRRDFVRWRFSNAGSHTVRRIQSHRRSKTLYGAYRCQHLGKLSIRVAINRNVNALDDAANLATMRAMMNIHIRLPRCLGLWAETRRRSKKPWPKSERANGEHGTRSIGIEGGTESGSEGCEGEKKRGSAKAEAIEIVIDGHGYRVNHVAMPGCSKINTHRDRCGVYYVNPIDGRER